MKNLNEELKCEPGSQHYRPGTTNSVISSWRIKLMRLDFHGLKIYNLSFTRMTTTIR